MLQNLLISNIIPLPKTKAGQHSRMFPCEIYHEKLTRFGSMAIIKMNENTNGKQYVLVIYVRNKGFVYYQFTDMQFDNASDLFDLLVTADQI